MTARFPLAMLPTPLMRAERLARSLGRREIWVKRDDLTGFMLAGNKARPLERLVADAIATGADTLVTGGEDGGPLHPNLALVRWHGAEVRFTGNTDRSSVDEVLEQVAANVLASGGRPYVMPRGGATVVGALAYVDAGQELADQLAAIGARPATVLVAAGSGGTAAGLVASTAGGRHPWRVVAAAVSRPPEETATRVLELARAAADHRGLDPSADADVDVLDARGPGYGLASDEGERAAELAAATEGLLLDPVFSAKAMGTLLANPQLPGPVVFWHTGGHAAGLAHLTMFAKES
jgi:1-aminocyclopropane-1-carboxylate deaminase/D-cysteine desulfhydrase-like pyridoxal-dependent ACC family enzyme